MRDTASVAAIAGIVAAAVAGLAGWLTQRAASKATVTSAQVTSLAEIERDAGKRAADIYRGAIETLEREQVEDRAEIAQLRSDVKELRQELAEARAELDTAKAVLRIRYPDEP